MMVTLTNDFHNTSARVRMPEGGGILSEHQQRRAERALCGMRDCTCGSVRGTQAGIPDGYHLDTIAVIDGSGSLGRWAIIQEGN